jgi:hypothetical protein
MRCGTWYASDTQAGARDFLLADIVKAHIVKDTRFHLAVRLFRILISMSWYAARLQLAKLKSQ